MTQAQNAERSALVDFDEIRKVFKSLPSCGAKELADELPPYLGPQMQARAFWLRSVFAKGGRLQLGMPKMVMFHCNNVFEDAPKVEADFSALIDALAQGRAMLNHLCVGADCSLQLYELDPASPVMHTAQGESLGIEEAAMALTYGMMTVEQQTDCLLAHAFGAGTERVALGLVEAILNGKAAGGARGFDRLRSAGSREIAALCGALIAARLAGIPAVVEGLTGLAAMAVLSEEAPQAISHCYYIEKTSGKGVGVPPAWPCFVAAAKIGAPEDVQSAGAAEMILAYDELKMVSALLCAGHAKAAA